MSKPSIEAVRHKITRFEPSVVEAIKDAKQATVKAQAAAMNNLANEVISNGGYCDELTFSTVFFGGIDPEMNWSDEFTNRQLAGEIPDEYKQARRLARTAAYSCYEPFVATQSGFADRKVDVGIVMPGADEYGSTTVGYRISQPEGWHPQAHSFIGEMVFKGYSKVRDYRPYDDHQLFDVVRYEGNTEAKCRVDQGIKFGVAAVREYVFPYYRHALVDEEIAEIYEYVEELRTRAQQHIKTKGKE